MLIYLLCSFAFAWLCWGLCWLISRHELALPLIDMAILGSFAPFIGAAIAAGVNGGVRGAMRFFARGLAWRMGWPVFLISTLLFPGLILLAGLLYAWANHQNLMPQMTAGEAPVVYAWLFLLGGALGEEFGWSYLSDRLDERFELGVASLLLGMVWGMWHLPLFFLDVPGLTQRFTPFYLFLLNSIALRFVFSWGYHRGRQSILANLLMHNSVNFGFSMVVIIPMVHEAHHTRLWLLIGLTAIASLVLYGLAPVRQDQPAAQTVMKPPPRMREPA